MDDGMEEGWIGGVMEDWRDRWRDGWMYGMGIWLGFGVQIVSGSVNGIDSGIAYLQIMILLFSYQTQKDNIWVSKP